MRWIGPLRPVHIRGVALVRKSTKFVVRVPVRIRYLRIRKWLEACETPRPPRPARATRGVLCCALSGGVLYEPLPPSLFFGRASI